MDRYTLAFAFISAVSGCASDPVQLPREPDPSSDAAHIRPTLGDPFRLRVGEVAAVEGTELLVTFRAVEADSRCPTDAQCVWAGDARASIGVGVAGGTREWIELHTGLEPHAHTVRGHTLTLVEVEPAARLDMPIASGDYVVVLRIERE